MVKITEHICFKYFHPWVPNPVYTTVFMVKITEHICFKYFHPTNYIFLLWSENVTNNFKYYVCVGVQNQIILLCLQRLEHDWSIFRTSVVYYGATWCTFGRKLKKLKKIHHEKNSLHFRKWNFLALILKKILCFLILPEMETPKKILIYFKKWKP